jgi:hypothetical protein
MWARHMNTNNSNDKPGTIIDLDADQVVEDFASAEIKHGTAAPLQKSQKSRWIYGAAALVAAAFAGGWIYKDVLSNYFPSDQIRGLSEKVLELESKNTSLREELSNIDKLASQLKSDVDSLEGKELALESVVDTVQKADVAAAAKLNSLEQSLVETKQMVTDMASRPVIATNGASIDAGLQQRVTNLEKDVASLKVKPAAPVDNTVALSQNLADLKAKIAAGTGYLNEYDRLQRMVPAAAGLDVLAPYAALGLPDAKGLASELKTMIADMPKPVIPGPVAESQGWWAGVYDTLSGLITIKVEGDVDWPTTASAAVAFADAGDLPQAIEHLNAVEGTKPVGVQQWLDRAQARLALEKAVQTVEEAVLRVIAAKG